MAQFRWANFPYQMYRYDCLAPTPNTMVVFLAGDAKFFPSCFASRTLVLELVVPAAQPHGATVGVFAFLVCLAVEFLFIASIFAEVCVLRGHRHFLGARVIPSPAHAEVTSRVAVLHLVLPAANALGTTEVLPFASAFTFPALAVASLALKVGTCKADSTQAGLLTKTQAERAYFMFLFLL